MSEVCNGHEKMVKSMDKLSAVAIAGEERFLNFLRFSKVIGSLTLLVLSVVAWVGIMLLSRVEKISADYQYADTQLLLRSVENKQEIAISREVLKRVEHDVTYIRSEIDKITKKGGER